MIFKIFSSKNLAKILVPFAQTAAAFLQKFDRYIHWFLR
jgi:hypothetical protein